MNYTSLVTKKIQYKYSANICFDMKDEEKLAEFIPNITTTEIIREYLFTEKKAHIFTTAVLSNKPCNSTKSEELYLI